MSCLPEGRDILKRTSTYLSLTWFRKGKLRRNDPIDLGKQYSGSRISRATLEAGSDDDNPFGVRSSEGEEEEEEEQESSGEEASEGDQNVIENSNIRGRRQRRQMDEEGVDESMVSDDESEKSEGDEEGSSIGASEESSDDAISSDGQAEAKKGRGAIIDGREEVRRLMASDQKAIATSISQAATADATKGKAVKQQRSTFDALLNTRIKLQKGVTAINEFPAEGAGDVKEDVIKSAESAALALWTSIEGLRLALADAQTVHDGSNKRKRLSSVSSTSPSTGSLWQRMADLESSSVPSRRKILDKWSVKVRGSATTMPNVQGKLLGSNASGQQPMSTVLDAQVATETRDRVAKRSKPNNDSSSLDSEALYDDKDFYQSLLRDLVEQRMSSTDSITNGLDMLNVNLPSQFSIHPITGMRNDKAKRRTVDVRASKGRKMRYNVHEKLQNFMAPEIRGTWTDHARDEFFASLLGKTASGLLQEDGADSDEENEEDRVEEGLRLFRG